MKYLILNAKIVNEGCVYESDVFIKNQRIEKVGKDLQSIPCKNIDDATGLHLLPGAIDDQVHFREPGLTHKASIYTESRAAVAGGVTSFMEMPNTVPPTFTQELLEEKYKIAEKDSLANYSFYVGASNDNYESIMRTDLKKVCGLKIFMGSSTGNLLVDNPNVIEKIFSNFPGLIATHCEHEPSIRKNSELFKLKYGEDISVAMHPQIRSEEACYLSSSFAVSMAKKHNTRLHVLHISTGKETNLFESNSDISNKRITAEACIHHLWFSDADYESLGSKIKWNPAVKTAEDREKVWEALLSDRIDVIATDHAPHTMEEKSNKYFSCPSGGPLIQHSIVAMMEHYHNKRISLEKIVSKMCHAPALLYRILNRGFIREGYYADIVLLNLNESWIVNQENILAKCKWSPFEGIEFKAKIKNTFISGELLYESGKLKNGHGLRLMFGN
jgi:dihydroorotase